MDGLRMLFVAMKPTQFINFNLQDYTENTILHILAKEYDTSHQAVVAVVDNLKAKQYINFGTQNSHKNTVMHELLSHGKFNIKDLKDVLKIMKKQSIQDVNISAFNENGRAVIYLALEKDRHTLKKKQQSLQEQSSITDRLDIYIHDMMDIIPPFDTDVRWVELSSYTIASIANVFAFKHNWEGTLSEKVDGLNKQTKHGKKHTFHVVVNSETIQSDTMMHRLITEQFPTVVNAKICTKQVSTDELISNTAFGYILQHFEDYPHYFDDLIQFYLAYGDQGYPLLFSSEPSTLIYSLFKSALPATHCFRTFDEIIRRFKVSMTAICDAQNGGNPIHHCLKQIQLNSKKQTQLVIQSVDVLGRAMVRKSEHCARTLLLPFLCDEEYDTESINYDFGMGKSSRIMRQCPDVIYLDQKQHRQGIKKLNILCERYPEWLLMEDKNGDIPLSVALHTKDIDSFFCIYRFMLERKVDMNVYFNDRAFIQQMIAFASSFVLNPGTNWIVKLLLSTLNYDEVFKWSADPNHFNPYLDSDISLVKSLSQIKEFKLSDTQEHLFSQFLSEQCENGVIYKQENASNRDSKNAHIHHVYPTQGVDLPNYDTEGEYETKLSFEYEDQRVNVMDLLEKPHASKAPSSSSSDHEEQASMTNWIELLYSTIVESCSALDLYSDVIILIALYKSHNHWWSTNMLMLLCAPYLVSYGSLVVLLRKKIEHKELSGCNIFFGYLLITPLSLVYLFCIDVLFMLFTLGSTLWFLLALTFLSIKNGCKVPSNLAEHDGRDWFERKVFIQWLQMNYTEMVSYRRLRTLSQLFFETIPQIVLQVWIISDIKWLGNENEFDLDDFEWKLTLSIGVAIAHLILEGGIMLLDRSAFEMGFMQYAMVSLGGRTLWVPFQHFIHKIVKYQIYIHRDGDCDECDRFDTDYFDAEEYNICEVNRSTNCTIGTNVLKLLYRDYADISTEVCGCVPYKIDYQFSVQDVQTLTQKLANAPLMLVPHAFELSTTNAVLQNLMRHLLCRAEIKLGSVSCENMDIFSLCKLYKVSLKKMKLNIDSIEIQTVDTMIDTSKIKHTNKGIDDINQIIESSLIAYGEASAIRWINTYRNLSYKQQTSIKNIILKQCVSQNGALRSLNCLQRSYKSNFYPGKHCEAMNRINEMIVQCHLRSKQHESWCFVIIFLLLYTRGSIFDMSCSNGCCSFLPLVVETREELSHYVPSHIKVDSSMIKIPFQMFEQCLWSRDYIESILVDRCKKYILDPRILQTKQIIKDFTVPNCKQEIATIAHEYKTLIDYVAKETQDRWPQHPLQQLHEIEVDVENVAYWDALFVALQLNTSYQDYLSRSLEHRNLLQHDYNIQYTEMKPRDIDNQTLYYHPVAPQQLLPQYKSHQAFKYQISRFQVNFRLQLRDLGVEPEEFDEYVMKSCTKDEKEALQTMLKASEIHIQLFDESRDAFLAKIRTTLKVLDVDKRCIEIHNAIINAAMRHKCGIKELQCSVYLNDLNDDLQSTITNYSTIYLWDWEKNKQDVSQYALDCCNRKLIHTNNNWEIVIITNIPKKLIYRNNKWEIVKYSFTLDVEYVKLYTKEEQSRLTDKSTKPLHRFSENDVISVIEHWVSNDVVYQKNKKRMTALLTEIYQNHPDQLKPLLKNSISNTIGSLTAQHFRCLDVSGVQETDPNWSHEEEYFRNWSARIHFSNSICNLSQEQLKKKICVEEVHGERFLELYNPGPKSDRTWIEEVTGWNSNEVRQVECILLRNETPRKEAIIESIRDSFKRSTYKDNKESITKFIKIFEDSERMDVEELYLKIRNALDINEERAQINDGVKAEINKPDVDLSCIASAFCTNKYQIERVFELKSKRLSSLAVSWKCGNCGCDNHGSYMNSHLQLKIDNCVLCGISEEQSVLKQLGQNGIYVQKYTPGAQPSLVQFTTDDSLERERMMFAGDPIDGNLFDEEVEFKFNINTNIEYEKVQTHISYDFGIPYDYPTMRPIHRSINNELFKCEQFKKNNRDNRQVFDDVLLKSITKCATEGASALKCAEYDPNHNIIRNSLIGIRHMFALITYCDLTVFCRFFRKTYRKNNRGSHSGLYHYARALFESVHFFGAEMDNKMKVYHGLNTKMGFSRFTSRFCQPLSTSIDSRVAQKFMEGGGMILELKRSEDQKNVTRYIDTQEFSRFSNEKEFLFYNAVFTIQDIIIAADGFKGRKDMIFMFNLLQKATKDEPTNGQWKSENAARKGIRDLVTLIDSIATISEVSQSMNMTLIDEVVRCLITIWHANRIGVVDFHDFCRDHGYDSDALTHDIKCEQSNIAHFFSGNTIKRITEFVQLADNRALLRIFCEERKSNIYIQSEWEMPSEIRAALVHDKITNRLSFIRFSNVFPNAKDIIFKDLSLDHVSDKVDEYCSALKQYIDIERKKNKKLMSIVLELSDEKEAEFALLKMQDTFGKKAIESWDVLRDMDRLFFKKKWENRPQIQRMVSDYAF
eukprot:128588_1